MDRSGIRLLGRRPQESRLKRLGASAGVPSFSLSVPSQHRPPLVGESPEVWHAETRGRRGKTGALQGGLQEDLVPVVPDEIPLPLPPRPRRSCPEHLGQQFEVLPSRSPGGAGMLPDPVLVLSCRRRFDAPVVKARQVAHGPGSGIGIVVHGGWGWGWGWGVHGVSAVRWIGSVIVVSVGTPGAASLPGSTQDGEEEVPDLASLLDTLGAGGTTDPLLGMVPVVDREVAPPSTVVAPEMVVLVGGLYADGRVHGFDVDRHAPRGILE